MTFSDLSQYFQRIEATPKRLEVTAIFSEMLKKLSVQDTDLGVYLSLGYLAPPFRSIQFNVAQKMMLRAISLAFNKPLVDVINNANNVGDLGIVAQNLSKTQDLSLTISQVYEKLQEIAEQSGAGSQERKLTKIASLLNKLDPVSCRFIARIVLGTMRLGFSDITVIEALSWFIAGDKSLKAKIEAQYRLHPDIGYVAKKIKEGGVKGLSKITLEVGVPVLVAKCARAATAEEVMDKMRGFAYAEDKYDGTRVQIHLDGKKVWTFTRNLEESTHMFPDLVEAILENVKAETTILDAEAIGYDKKTGEFIPFQQTIKRKRKHDVAQHALDIPLTLRVFDILYLNGESLIDKSLNERWGILQSVLAKSERIQLANRANVTNANQLLEIFEDAVSRGLEGVVIKNPTAKYAVGNRGFAWIKFKREESGGLEDTIDAVVLGYYFGTGKRTSFGIGAFLIGLYDPKTDTYKTLSKIGTGLTDEEWVGLKNKCDKVKLQKPLSDVAIPDVLKCDVYCNLSIVVVVRADNITISPTHTAGYALRFPRLIAYRADKSAKDTTTIAEIANMYKLQKKK